LTPAAEVEVLDIEEENEVTDQSLAALG